MRIMGCEEGTKQLLEKMPQGDKSDNQNSDWKTRTGITHITNTLIIQYN